MKKINELVNGECVVIAVNKAGTEKRVKGVYDSKLKVVFMCLTSNYEVIGYEQ